MTIRRLCLLLSLALAALAPAAPALAQTPATTLLELKISLWPEYDKPTMLVIYRGQVAQSAPGPATVLIQVPASAASSLTVAYDNNGQLLIAQHTDTPSGASLNVAVTSPNGTFDVEYYDSSLDVSSSSRKFSFAAAMLQPVESLTLEVQQPYGVSGLTGNPALANSQAGPDGLTYYSWTRSNVAANETLKQDVTYTKANSDLSITKVSAPAPGSNTGGNSGSGLPTPVTASGPTPWNVPLWVGFVGVAAVILVLGGLFWYARPRWRTARSRRGPRRAASSEEDEPAAPRAGAETVFCHECGTRSRPGDRFCGNCGAELRRSQ